VYAEPTDLCASHTCETDLDETNKFCYKATAYETSRLIAKKLGLAESDYTVAFQSRLDDNWLTPFSDKVIENFAKDGMKRLLVFSPAFVADCLETLIEVGSEYQGIFAENGGETVTLVHSCNTEPIWVNGLADFIRARSA
jgi:ferrochelatase